jgi:hypothetical protein
MIRFRRDGQHVQCSINCDIPNYEERVFSVYWNAGNEWAAGLLSAETEKQMYAKLERIRCEAYEEGWRAAKAKKAKRKYFNLGWFTRG